MKGLRIRVFKKDIVAGVKEDATLCPIAKAARRAGLKDVWVDWDTLTANSIKPISEHYLLPLRAQRFIKAFDAGRKVRPFNFRASWIGRW